VAKGPLLGELEEKNRGGKQAECLHPPRKRVLLTSEGDETLYGFKREEGVQEGGKEKKKLVGRGGLLFPKCRLGWVSLTADGFEGAEIGVGTKRNKRKELPEATTREPGQESY